MSKELPPDKNPIQCELTESGGSLNSFQCLTDAQSITTHSSHLNA